MTTLKDVIDIFERGGKTNDEEFRRIKSIVDKSKNDELLGLVPPLTSPFAFYFAEFLFSTQPLGSRVVQSLLQRFLKIREFFTVKSNRGLSIIDLMIIYSRSDFVQPFFLGMRDFEQKLDLGSNSKISCLLGLVMSNLETKSLRLQTLELLFSFIENSSPVDPNLEVGYLTDCSALVREVTSIISSRDSFLGNTNLVNYCGLRDPGLEYRRRVSEIVKPSKRNLEPRFFGETLFSVLLRHSNHYRHRKICVELMNRGIIDLKTIVTSLIDKSTTCYQSLLFEKPLKTVLEALEFVIENTPGYVYHLPSAGDPLGKITREVVCSGWEGHIIATSGGGKFRKILLNILSRYHVLPERGVLEKYIAQGGILRELNILVRTENRKPFWQGMLDQIPSTTPLLDVLLKTGLSKILLTQKFLLTGQPLTKEILRRAFLTQYDSLKPFSIRRNEKSTPINETFLSSEDLVIDYLADSNVCFVTEEDNYAFRLEEFEYLIERGENPYNRRKLTPGEISSLKLLIDNYRKWWWLYSFLAQPLSQYNVSDIDLLVTEIDNMLNQSPFFVYGERLRPQLPKLSCPGIVGKTYEYLLNGSLGGNIENFCVPFNLTPKDHVSIEEINTYFGVLLPRFAGTQGGLRVLLQWIFHILDSTRRHSSQTLYEGRLFNLYNVILHFLKIVFQ